MTAEHTLPSGAPVVAITGAGRGIGAATAHRFAREGWQVVLLDRDPQTLAQMAAALGAACVYAREADVTSYASLASAAAEIAEKTARVDVLVNNAGILRVGPFETIPPHEAEAQIRVNVLGVVNGIYAFFEALKATPGARIVNLASASSIYGVPDFAVYSATKFAVRGLTEALEIEFRRHGIVVCDISPPFVSGDMLASQRYVAPGVTKQGIKMGPETVANWVYRAATAKYPHVHYTLQNDHRLLRPFSAIVGLARPSMAKLMGYA